MKMKNTTWKPLTRTLFIRIHGRISTIEAPVVPMKFAATAPTARKATFTAGVASPRTRM